MTRVKLPTILRSHAGGERDVDASGTTLRELLADLESRYPGVTAMVLTDDGALHRFVNVYVNDEDVRYLGSLETEVEPGDTDLDPAGGRRGTARALSAPRSPAPVTHDPRKRSLGRGLRLATGPVAERGEVPCEGWRSW